jgi:hypothetical protein
MWFVDFIHTKDLAVASCRARPAAPGCGNRGRCPPGPTPWKSLRDSHTSHRSHSRYDDDGLENSYTTGMDTTRESAGFRPTG